MTSKYLRPSFEFCWPSLYLQIINVVIGLHRSQNRKITEKTLGVEGIRHPTQCLFIWSQILWKVDGNRTFRFLSLSNYLWYYFLQDRILLVTESKFTTPVVSPGTPSSWDTLFMGLWVNSKNMTLLSFKKESNRPLWLR